MIAIAKAWVRLGGSWMTLVLCSSYLTVLQAYCISLGMERELVVCLPKRKLVKVVILWQEMLIANCKSAIFRNL